jgi:hypothetical protein
MSTPLTEVRPVEDPTGHLELAFIDQFIRSRGYDPAALAALPAELRQSLQKLATAYAGAKLAEMESRAHYVHELHSTE